MRVPHCEELPFSERRCKSTRSMTVWVDVDNVTHISTKKNNPLGLLSFQGFRLCYAKMLMFALKIIFHIEKHLFVVLIFEHPSKERA